MRSEVIRLPRGYDWRRIFLTVRSPMVNLALIAVGSVIFAFGMNGILIPSEFISGGLIGLSILVHYLFPSVNVGIAYLLLNLPLAVLGWFHISRRFMLYTIFGVIFFSVAAVCIQPQIAVIEDPLLAALLAGVICGVGGGLTLRSLGSAGGFDILGIYINKRFGFRVGSGVFLVKTGVLLGGAFMHDLHLTLYSMIFYFTCSMVVNKILTGFNLRKSLIVISDRAEEIAGKILSKGRKIKF